MNSLKDKLEERKRNDRFRVLKVNPGDIDFYSNDYLGFAHDGVLIASSEMILSRLGAVPVTGATGSRLISGNFPYTEQLEKSISQFHRSEAALIFNSGYDANLGLISSVAGKEDTFVYDQLCHASIIDGMRLSPANRIKFEHNNLSDLEAKLSRSKGAVFVITESVFSMDGDLSPLKEISELCKRYNAQLIVDEAHSSGIFEKEGRGIVCELGLEEAVFARVHTFGKALGCHGAAVLGSSLLKDFLINHARSFIYTTALPLHSLAFIGAAYELLPHAGERRKKLFENMALFSKLTGHSLSSPIAAIFPDSTEKTKALADVLNKEKIMVKAILPPTVPQGGERIRICLHAFNTTDEIEHLLSLIEHETIHYSGNSH